MLRLRQGTGNAIALVQWRELGILFGPRFGITCLHIAPEDPLGPPFHEWEGVFTESIF